MMVALFGLAIYSVLASTVAVIQGNMAPELMAPDEGIVKFLFDHDVQNQSLNSSSPEEYELRAKQKKDDGLIRFKIPLKHAKGSKWGMVGKIRVGFKGKRAYNVMFDTQSSNMLMLRKSSMDTNHKYLKKVQDIARFYSPKNSVMAHPDMDTHFRITYSDGSSYSGGRVHDGVWIWPKSSNFFYMPFAAINDINPVAKEKRGVGFEGIVGLGSPGFVKHYDDGHCSVLNMLINENNLGKRGQKQEPFLGDNPIFAFYASKSGKTGELMFGGFNEKLLAKGATMKYFDALILSTKVDEPEPFEFLDDSLLDDASDAMSEISDESETLVIFEDGTGGSGHPETRRQRRQPKLTSQHTRAKDKLNTKKPPLLPEKDVVWGIKLESVNLGKNKIIATEVNALFCSTLPYGVTVPTLGRLKGMVNFIGNGATLDHNHDIVIPCDQLKSSSSPLPDLTLVAAKKGGGEVLFTFTASEYFPDVFEKQGGEGEEKKECMRRSFFGVAKGGVVPDGETGVAGAKEDDDSHIPSFKLGIPFMKKYYTVYDYHGVDDKQPAQIGIALSSGKEI